MKGFLARYNRRFSRPARQAGNLHRKGGLRLEQSLCIKEPRVVANDGTVRIYGRHLQLLPPGLRPLAQRGVTVAISPKGRTRVFYAGRELPYRVLPPPQPRRPAELETPVFKRRGHGPGDWRPGADHPWRKIRAGAQR